ncbi:hypothetical protein SDC9_113178 [bioreactor metagenome]|uniref:DUF2953 domain-containing protein n=2 Tax=root TaxID=1 RepID=A0A1G9LHI1_9FIRM|nr:DUF2953 domain-containing protein [Romboutsia lituseburensis]CEH35297.1 Protein of unknown function (DUF2953) [Romboutsia lituseburensis]SDL60975.1 Protein of unknown function [Romboutsia lituseburensis DSM 797]
MRYNEIFLITILILIIFTSMLIFKFIKSSINIIIIGEVNNNNININLNIKYMFNLINIKIPIYPLNKVKVKKDKNKSKKNIKHQNIKIDKKSIEVNDIKNIINLIFKVKVEEIYSYISFGNENVIFTSFIYVFINTIYGNVINIFSPNKIYLNITPDFTKNYIKGNVKIHIKPTIKDIINISIAMIKIYKKVKVNKRIKKDGGKIEINRVNTKSYGKNI